MKRASNDVKRDPQAYIKYLEDKNRRLRETKKLSESDRVHLKLEQGFQTHYSGANQLKECHTCLQLPCLCCTRQRRVPRNSRLANAGSFIASTRNRKTWDPVIEPSFSKFSHENEENNNDENIDDNVNFKPDTRLLVDEAISPRYSSDEFEDYLSSCSSSISDSTLKCSDQIKGPTCLVPVLPRGTQLEVEIISSWGCDEFVGLQGIDVFDHTGHLIRYNDEDFNSIVSIPKESELPATNLVNDHRFSCDDRKGWLANKAEKNRLMIHFECKIKISMIRFWNYNKNRVYSYRGVKELRIFFDGNLIFKGEIKKAPGLACNNINECVDMILFTCDQDILDSIQSNDPIQDIQLSLCLKEKLKQMKQMNVIDNTESKLQRRRSNCSTKSTSSLLCQATAVQPLLTYQQVLNIEEELYNERSPTAGCIHPNIPTTNTTSMIAFEPTAVGLKGRHLNINLTETWGDQYYLGLNGLAVLIQNENGDMEEFQLNPDQISAMPSDINVHGHSLDPRTVDKLVDGLNNTCDDTHMWLVEFTPGQDHQIFIDFGKDDFEFIGLRIWNYNKHKEDARRGAKRMHLQLDGNRISPEEGIMLRKAIGFDSVPFAQTIIFPFVATPARATGYSDLIEDVVLLNQWDTAGIHPCGYSIRFDLLSSHGDTLHIGLDDIQLVDSEGGLIDTTDRVFTTGAFIAVDHRMGDSILVPLTPGRVVSVHISLDNPVVLSKILIWNYSQVPMKGVEDISIWMDNMVIFMGRMQLLGKSCPQTVCFGSAFDEDDTEEQQVLFINDHIFL